MSLLTTSSLKFQLTFIEWEIQCTSGFRFLALYFKCQKRDMVNGSCDMDSCPSRAGLH